MSVKKNIVKKFIEEKQKVIEESEDNTNSSENESSSESSSEEDCKPNKNNKLKVKQTFDEISVIFGKTQKDIKEITTKINELEKEISILHKQKNKLERSIHSTIKDFNKAHTDEVSQASKIKSKSKRKGNVNGGFNKEIPVPEQIRNYIGIDKDVMMSRPKVMSALNNKLKEDGCKLGQNTTLNKSVVASLGLNKKDIGRVIKFGEFQKWLASFYTTVQEENEESEESDE